MLPDYPIRSSRDDLLRRIPLAKRIADLISQFQSTESFVIGIDGAWGSGKTSFVNLVAEELVKASNILTVRFNPWNFSSRDELISDFFDSLAAAMRGHVKREKQALKVVRRYAGKLSFSVSPEVSFMGVKVGLGELGKYGGRGTLDQERAAIDRLMEQLQKRIVVMIDDTDRLDAEETKLVFKLVKMTANFPNTIFIIAFDREKVAKKIQEDGLPGEEYLKKIIQVNFRLPQPEQQDLYRILFHDIDTVMGDIDERKWDAKRWSTLFQSGFKDFFKTVRDIKRYVSSLTLDVSIVGKEEINPVDFLGVELIRVFAPDVYTAIGDNRELFTEGRSSAWQRDNEAAKKRVETILELLQDDESRNSLRELLKELFPRIESLYRGASYGSTDEPEWRKTLRVTAPDIFGRYFQLTTPSGTMSEEAITSLMASCGEVAKFTAKLTELQSENKLRNALVRAVDYLETLKESDKKNLVVALLNFGDEVESHRLGMFDMQDEDTLVFRLIYHAVESVRSQERAAFLKGALEESNSIYTAFSIVEWLVHENAEYRDKQSFSEPAMGESDLTELKSLCIARVKTSVADNRLLTVKRLPSVLFRWKEWGTNEDLHGFIRQVIGSKKGLASLLATFVSEVLATSGNYKRLSKKAVGELYDINDIEAKVAEVTEADLESMDEQEREAVRLFRNPVKDRFSDLD